MKVVVMGMVTTTTKVPMQIAMALRGYRVWTALTKRITAMSVQRVGTNIPG